MNGLLEVYEFLNQATRQDALLCLAQTVAWLDPISFDFPELDFYEDQAGILQNALLITRDHFHDVYADAINHVRAGAGYEVLDDLIGRGISTYGIEMTDLEFIPYGIPVPAYGVELEDPDFYSTHPETLPLLQCFGVDIQPDNPYRIEIAGCVNIAAYMITESLEQCPEEAWHRLALALRWIFAGGTGNSICDWSYEIMSEAEALPWDELDFALTMIHEANEIMADVHSGLAWINDHPAMLENLKANIQRIYKALDKRKGDNDEYPAIRLEWSTPATGAQRAT